MRWFASTYNFVKFFQAVALRNRSVAKITCLPFKPPRTDFKKSERGFISNSTLSCYTFGRVFFATIHFQNPFLQFWAPRQVSLDTWLRGCCLTSVAPDSTSHVRLRWFFQQLMEVAFPRAGLGKLTFWQMLERLFTIPDWSQMPNRLNRLPVNWGR